MTDSIQVEHLVRRFGAFTAVDDVSFTVAEGEIFGLLGPNGAGKTTVMKVLTGLLLPTSGSCRVASLDVVTETEAIRRRIGYMSQLFSLYADLTVGENIAFFGGLYDVVGDRLAARRKWALEMAGLTGQENRRTADLPLGWKQRLALGCAVLHEPAILFLDEPTSGVDPVSRRQFWDLIYSLAERGTTVIVSTHYMEEAEYCHRVALMNQGRLIALDRPAALRASNPDPILEIDTDRVLAAVGALEQAPEVIEAVMFGRRVHVTVHDAVTARRELPGFLQRNGIQVSRIEPVAASLEDVVVALIRRAGDTAGSSEQGAVSGEREVETRSIAHPARSIPAQAPANPSPLTAHRLVTSRLWAVSRKEFLQLRRDSRSLVMAFVLPVILVLLFGYAISWDVNDIPIAVYDGDASARSRELLDAFRSSGYFRVTRFLDRQQEADALLDRGAVRMVLLIPPGYAARLSAGRLSAVQALVDGADANTAAITLNYAAAIAGQYTTGNALFTRGAAAADVRVWYNESLDSRITIVPGLVAVVMMIIATMLTSLTIAREWERGTMEQLAATPVHPLEVVLGKMLPYLAIGLFDVLVTVSLGIMIFHVPFRGHAWQLFGASFFFLLGSLGLGIFISAATRSQLLATQLSMLVTFLPGFLLSGFAFDIEGMPRVLQAVTFLVPARYFIIVTRGIFLKGVGPGVLWPQGLALVVYAAAGLGLATRVFRKRIDA
ncbi:MAG: ABC transporter permease [Gemmatimonadota bacterium]